KAPGPSMSPTIDQIIAGRIGQETSLPSMEVCSENETQAVACEAGFGCLYSSTISYRNANSPLPMESNPRKIFAQLSGEGATAEERVAVVRQKRSILDFITERTRALQLELGPGDKVLLDGYLDTVREIERRVQLAQNRDLSNVEAPEIPVAAQDMAIDKEVRLLFDLIAVAYQADLTRVASYIMIGEGTNRTIITSARRTPSIRCHITPIMSIGLKSWSRFSAITWSGSRNSSRNSPPHPTAKARCWTTPCCSTAPTWGTATCTPIIRCRPSWWAAAPARSRRG